MNLTPHELIIFNEKEEEIERVPSSGIVRVKEANQLINYINDVPVYKKSYLESEGLPAPKENTYYFVSIIVAQANPARKDLILSSDLIRDEQGRILGCKSFAQL